MNTPIYGFIPATGDGAARMEPTGRTSDREPLPVPVAVRVEEGRLRLSLDVAASTFAPANEWVWDQGTMEFARFDFGAFVLEVPSGARAHLDIEGVNRVLGLRAESVNPA